MKSKIEKPKSPVMHCHHTFMQIPGTNLARCVKTLCGHIIFREINRLGVKK